MKLGIKLQFSYTGTEKEAYQSSLKVFRDGKEVNNDIEIIYFEDVFKGLKVNSVASIASLCDDENDPYFCIKTEAGVYPLKKEGDKNFYFKAGESYVCISKAPTLEEFNDFCKQIEELKGLIEKKLEELTRNSINITKEF